MYTLNQIFTDLDKEYVYSATTSGLDVIDIELEEKVAYANNSDGYTSLWASEDVLYLGTNNSGLKYINKSDITGNVVSLVDLSSQVQDYNFEYKPSVNEIRYIHGHSDILSVVTPIGIDVFRNDRYGFKSVTVQSGITKCFMTTNNELYYIVQHTTDSGIFRTNNVLCDWGIPDIVYTTGVSFLPLYIDLNDLCVTTNTSDTLINNTLFVATSSGTFVLDEETLEFNAYYTQ